MSFHPMTNGQLERVAPSIFAVQPWDGVSDRYVFVPTIAVVDMLRREGFEPVKAQQSRTRIVGKEGFTKHLVRFRHRDLIADRPLTTDDLGTLYPEIVVTNSHDTGSAFKVDLGIFRLVCTNGMVVGDHIVPPVSIRHTGRPDEVIDAAFRVIENAPLALESAREMHDIGLSAGEQAAFAAAAQELRWPSDEDEAPRRVVTSDIIRPRRWDDKGSDLWATLNRAQENIIKGGVRVRSEDGRKVRRAPGVGSVDGDRKLNKALWTLAEEMRRLKAA